MIYCEKSLQNIMNIQAYCTQDIKVWQNDIIIMAVFCCKNRYFCINTLLQIRAEISYHFPSVYVNLGIKNLI